MTNVINREVAINSFYFVGGNGRKVFPRQMELDGRFVTFASDGLRFLIHRGEELVRLFDMNDGATTYRLRQEGDQWILVGTI